MEEKKTEEQDPIGNMLELEDFNPDDFTITLKNLSKMRFDRGDIKMILINLGYILMFNAALAFAAYLFVLVISGDTGASTQPPVL